MRAPKTTTGFTFHLTASLAPDHLFAVAADIPALDALCGASDLLSMIEEAMLSAALDEEPLQGNSARMAHYALESARAVLNAVIDGMERERLGHKGIRQHCRRISAPEA